MESEPADGRRRHQVTGNNKKADGGAKGSPDRMMMPKVDMKALACVPRQRAAQRATATLELVLWGVGC